MGIHYIGEMANNTLTKVFMDQLTEGQLGWAEVEELIDKVELGVGDDRTTHHVVKGRDKFIAALKKDFPDEHKAIDKFFADIKVGIVTFETRRRSVDLFTYKIHLIMP